MSALRSLSLLLALACVPVLASAENTSRVTVEGTEVSFVPPPEMKPLAAEVIAVKFPQNNAPRFVVGDKNAATTVAYDYKPAQLPADQLPQAKKAFTEIFERMIPGIEWKKNDIVPLGGQDWIALEFTSRATDTDVHNIMLATSYNGRLLVFNFNSTKSQFPKAKAALRKSIQSIQVKR